MYRQISLSTLSFVIKTKQRVKAWFCHACGRTISFEIIGDVTRTWLAAILDFETYTEEYPLYDIQFIRIYHSPKHKFKGKDCESILNRNWAM